MLNPNDTLPPVDATWPPRPTKFVVQQKPRRHKTAREKQIGHVYARLQHMLAHPEHYKNSNDNYDRELYAEMQQPDGSYAITPHAVQRGIWLLIGVNKVEVTEADLQHLR